MPKFVVTEIWTRTHVVDAPHEEAALKKGEPHNFPFQVTNPHPNARRGEMVQFEGHEAGLNLSNWHATEVK